MWTRRRAAAVETCRRPAFSRRCRQQASVRTTTTTTTTAPAAPYSRPTSTLPQPGPPTRSRFRQDHSRLLQVQSSCPSSCLGPGVEAFPDHSWAVLVLVWQNWFCLRHCFFITPLFNVSKLFLYVLLLARTGVTMIIAICLLLKCFFVMSAVMSVVSTVLLCS